MSNPINKLTLTDLQRLRNKTVYSIPDNPSNKGFSAAQLKGKIADPILLVAEWVKALSEEAFALGASVDGIDNGKVDKLTTSGQYVYAHLGSTQGELPVAATATGGTIAKRESDGRLKVATPSSDGDATTKAYVDTGLGGKVDKTSSANKVYITDDTGAQATVGYDDYVDGGFVRRNTDNQIYVPAMPTAPTHAVSRSYADGLLSRANLVSIIGTATTVLSGLMSDTDKARLDALYALLGSEADADNIVNTINEVLAIFDQYPEGADLVSVLGNIYTKTEAQAMVDAKIANVNTMNVISDLDNSKTYTFQITVQNGKAHFSATEVE